MNKIEELCKVLGMSYEEVMNGGRWRHLVRCRKAIAIALHKHGYSFCMIGRMMQRNHATIIYHVNGLAPDKIEQEYIRILGHYIEDNWNRDDTDEQRIRYPLFPQPGPL